MEISAVKKIVFFKDFNSPCQHDEGSPLIQNSAVVGIFSFNRGCGINQIASVFTNVLAYFDWLIREAGSQPSTCIKNQPFVCPTDTGSYPIWPSACTSQQYVCINGVPVLDVKNQPRKLVYALSQ